MTRNPFAAEQEALPRILPIFPLPAVLLLPRGRLPLNVFEPRYLAMIEDALGQSRLIGMIQPTDARTKLREPPVYEVGCAGRITTFEEADDGRLLITLTGVCRFTVAHEMPLHRGYRRVVPDWTRFADDLLEEPPVSAEGAAGPERARLIAGLRGYFRAQGIEANWEAVESTPVELLVTSVAMICPFNLQEKQALLEAATLADRVRLLIGLVEMAVLERVGGHAPVCH